MNGHDELWSAHYRDARRLNLLAAKTQEQHHNLAHQLTDLRLRVQLLEDLFDHLDRKHQDTNGD